MTGQTYWEWRLAQEKVKKLEADLSEERRRYEECWNLWHMEKHNWEAENKRLREAIQIAISGGRPLGGQIDPEECCKNMLWVLEGALALNKADTDA